MTDKREERRRQRELDEARKAGTVAPELDDEGNAINPHIPSYIKDAPWYLNSGQPSLKHQRMTSFGAQETEKIDGKWYARGQFKGPAATKYRKGACENCGAMTHKTKDCVERPRKLGAKWTNEDIRPDEIIRDVALDFEGKRDRWNGFEPEMYGAVMDRFKAAEELRLRKEAEMAAQKTEEEKLAEAEAAAEQELDEGEQFASSDAKTRTTVRNLRIREDRAKYLHNLSLDSAYYDPKSRSMHENPYEGKNPEDVTYAGDNWTRGTGDAQTFKELEMHSWELAEKGQLPNIFATPSEAAVMIEEMKKRKAAVEEEKKQKLLEQYGGEEHVKRVPPIALLVGQSEEYREYTKHGQLVKGPEVAVKGNVPVSKYEEDVLEQNHTAVWGSFFEAGQWGYACCHQLHRQAFCTGSVPEKPKAASVFETVKEIENEGMKKRSSRSRGRSSERFSEKRSTPSSSSSDSRSSSSESSEESSSESSRQRRRRRKEKKRGKKSRERSRSKGKKSSKRSSRRRSESPERGRKRKYHSISNAREPKEDEMDEYRRKRLHWDDPMKQ